METNILRLISIADLATIANAICGILAIFAILRSNPILSAQLLLVAFAFDSIDGFLARRFNPNSTDNLFGINIDSIADIISFGIAPAIIIYMFSNNYWIIIISIIIMVCGLLRLARYNTIAQQQITSSNTYIGLPIPITSLALSSLILSSVYDIYVISILFIIISILMVSNFEYPKFNDIRIFIIPVIIAVLSFIPSVNLFLRSIPSYLLIVVALLYIFGCLVYPYIMNRYQQRRPTRL